MGRTLPYASSPFFSFLSLPHPAAPASHCAPQSQIVTQLTPSPPRSMPHSNPRNYDCRCHQRQRRCGLSRERSTTTATCKVMEDGKGGRSGRSKKEERKQRENRDQFIKKFSPNLQNRNKRSDFAKIQDQQILHAKKPIIICIIKENFRCISYGLTIHYCLIEKLENSKV